MRGQRFRGSTFSAAGTGFWLRLTACIDIGSMATKAVIFDGEVRGEAVVPTGWEPREAGLRALREALAGAGLPEGRVERVVGTGYGRVSLLTSYKCKVKFIIITKPKQSIVITDSWFPDGNWFT